MTNPQDESAAVLAFIRERQTDVLAETIRQLSTCSADDLPAVLHKASGSVGSYQLTEAHTLIAGLSAVVSDPASSVADIEQARTTTLDALRATGTGVPT